MERPPTFTLGQRVRDITTGFEGIAIGRAVYLNGCHQYLVKPQCITKDDEPMKQPEGWYIDDQSLELIDQGILNPPAIAIGTGGTVKRMASAVRRAVTGNTGGPDVQEGNLPT